MKEGKKLGISNSIEENMTLYPGLLGRLTRLGNSSILLSGVGRCKANRVTHFSHLGSLSTIEIQLGVHGPASGEQ